MPSKKSKTAPRIINNSATERLPVTAWAVAIAPQIRLQQVMLLGICLVIKLSN